MKQKDFLILMVAIIIAACFIYFTDGMHLSDGGKGNVQIDEHNDEEYVIYPSDSLDGKWNLLFSSGDLYIDLKPEQIAVFFKSGEIPIDTTWVVYPQCEYQLTMEDKTIIVEDFGRPICELPYNQTGKLGELLLKDNE